ncbi:MAG: hypothetical protein M0D55_04325 [Elusimicrobiota bacterium]|nr:MAG: hypothetical protein M0D55_04325 [Elusimicrobiota bacterium]
MLVALSIVAVSTGVHFLAMIFAMLFGKELLIMVPVLAIAYVLHRCFGPKDSAKISLIKVVAAVGAVLAVAFMAWLVYVMAATNGAPFGH